MCEVERRHRRYNLALGRRALDRTGGVRLRFARHDARFAKGERPRHICWDEVVTQQQTGLGWGDEQNTFRRQQTHQHGEGAVLRGAVEVDQHIAAENHVVAFHSWQKTGGEQIALLKLHLPAHGIAQTISMRGRFEVTVAKPQFIAAKRILPVHRVPGPRQRARADIHGVDTKAVRRETGVEQGHRHRIRLFAGRGRQAQQAQMIFRVGSQPVLIDREGQRREGLAVSEEPGLGHDDRFNQFLQLSLGHAHTFPVGMRFS